ncbi:hypothetical protein KAU09_02505 [Candidatus Parcubacteria bacterium]|nr:hypothetical protein [Candidatus Parcubacteria bacterium]
MNEFKEDIFNKKQTEEENDDIKEDYYLEISFEEKKKLKKELEKRKNNLGKIDFEFCFTDNESLEEVLQNQDIFTREDIISETISQGDITVDQLLDYFVFTKRPKNKFVVIESLLGFSDDKDQEKINNFLVNIASSYREDEDDYAFAKGSKLERFYLQGYCEGRLPYTNSNARTIKYAAINSLANLNDDYKEDALLETFNNYQSAKTKKHDNNFSATGSANIYSSTILRILSQNGSRKSIDFAIDFIKNNDFSVNESAKLSVILTEIDAEYSAGKLLELLNDNSLAKEKKELTVFALYRLEFGQIGISEKGVKYLGKMYDLEQLNNPDYFVQRLTAKGEMGVFDDKRVLQKYFNLDDLAGKEKAVKPQVHDFAYETLFYPKEGETENERMEREKCLQEFKENYFDFYDDDFWQKTGVRINNLNFREQGWFLIFYKHSNDEIKEELLDFVKSYGENGLKTFISLEFGEDMGEKILDIGKSLKDQPEIADSIFHKYGEIIDLTKAAEDQAKVLFGKEKDISEEDIDDIIKTLMAKSDKMLKHYHGKVTENKEYDEQELTDELKKINGNIILLNQILKNMSREEIAEIDLREISSIEKIENLPAKELLNNQELLDKILEIIEKQFPPGDAKAFVNECENNENLLMTIVLANNEILSFFGKENKSDNIEYIDWFISNPDAPLKGLGEATIRLEFSEQESQDKLYYAVVKPHVKSFAIMVEKLGFVSFGGSTKDEEYKHHYARCRKLPEDFDFKSKKLSAKQEESLINSIKETCKKPESVSALLFGGSAYNICKIKYHGQTSFDDIKKIDPDGWLLTEIENQYEKGFVLARFIPESKDKDNQIHYVVFEKDTALEDSENELWEVINHGLEEKGLRASTEAQKKLSAIG